MGKSREALTQRSAWQLVDANANRALEGLRVCEDVVRLHLRAGHSFQRLRTLRHATARAMDQLPGGPRARLLARASARDVGRHAWASRIDSLERLLLINFQRVKESLRVLEECARIVAPRRSARFQQLRFQTYGVERDIILHVATLRHH